MSTSTSTSTCVCRTYLCSAPAVADPDAPIGLHGLCRRCYERQLEVREGCGLARPQPTRSRSSARPDSPRGTVPARVIAAYHGLPEGRRRELEEQWRERYPAVCRQAHTMARQTFRGQTSHDDVCVSAAGWALLRHLVAPPAVARNADGLLWRCVRTDVIDAVRVVTGFRNVHQRPLDVVALVDAAEPDDADDDRHDGMPTYR